MSFSSFDHECMALAMRLAAKGLYSTHPNPRVGCVIADAGKVLACGWHRAAGQAHAEILALAEAGSAARGSTAYVTLEPCSHHGRTPPCTEAMIEAGIRRVVVALADPNPAVDGRGIARLREAGVEVEGGLTEELARALNAGFVKRMAEGRPWVRVKCAQSLDGRTALKSGESRWISSPQSRRDVQHWRARSDALLTGIGTVVADDPRMTVRLGGDARQPLRVIADSRFRIEPESRILQQPGRALVVGCAFNPMPRPLLDRGIECLALPGHGQQVDLPALLRALAEREINEVQVEAGSALCGALLDQRLVDEILLYQAPVLLGDQAPAAFRIGPLESMDERVHLEVLETVRVGPDWRIRLKPDYGA